MPASHRLGSRLRHSHLEGLSTRPCSDARRRARPLRSWPFGRARGAPESNCKAVSDGLASVRRRQLKLIARSVRHASWIRPPAAGLAMGEKADRLNSCSWLPCSSKAERSLPMEGRYPGRGEEEVGNIAEKDGERESYPLNHQAGKGRMRYPHWTRTSPIGPAAALSPLPAPQMPPYLRRSITAENSCQCLTRGRPDMP